MGKIFIIGIGAEGAASLSSAALESVRQAELLIGGERLLAMFPDVDAPKVAIKSDLGAIVKAIRDNRSSKKIRVLASGDPDFFGIARYLVQQLGKDTIEIVPAVSSMQLAFARIKESWEDAVFLSVHARTMENVLEIIRNGSKICLFTDGKNTPDAIGRFLLDRGITDFKAFVCQELGSEKEKIFEGSLEQLTQQRFLPLNVLILIKTGGAQDVVPGKQDFLQRLGIPDEEFHQVKPLRPGSGQVEKGLITKMEVRSVSLAKMGIREDSIVWDIGAGSGAVSVEASFLAKKGKVFAIEKDEERLKIIKKNIKKFSAGNIQVVKAFAPEGLESLPDPDSVFIGGSGSKISEILEILCLRTKTGGCIVVNIATIENLNLALRKLKERGLDTEIVYLSVARGKEIKGLHRLEGMNPVFIITAKVN